MARMIETHDGWVLRDDWAVDDIQSVAECMGLEITDGMAHDVMHMLASSYDANVGINWEIVEQAIEQITEKEQAK